MKEYLERLEAERREGPIGYWNGGEFYVVSPQNEEERRALIRWCEEGLRSYSFLSKDSHL